MPDLSQDFIILVPMKAIRSLASFYLGFLPAAWLLTLICIGSFHWLYPVYGWGPFMYFFWFKVLSMGLVWYATNQYRRQTSYYYFNLGYSKAFLWTVTLCLDFVLFIIIFIALEIGSASCRERGCTNVNIV